VDRRPLRLLALSPPFPSLPPGAGNEADKLEGERLERAKEEYRYVLGQPDGHARAVTADGDGGESVLPLGLAHLARVLLP
jgi:hypothetical protein